MIFVKICDISEIYSLWYLLKLLWYCEICTGCDICDTYIFVLCVWVGEKYLPKRSLFRAKKKKKIKKSLSEVGIPGESTLGFFFAQVCFGGGCKPRQRLFLFFSSFFPKCIFLPKYALSGVANPGWSKKEEEKYYWLCLMLATPDKATTTTKLLSQVFGVGYMNQKRITPDRAHRSAFSTYSYREIGLH